MEPTETAMTCAYCGKQFVGNPRSQPLGAENYCSVSCEEGRGTRAMSDPLSPDYHLYLKGDPDALVGETLVCNGGVLGTVVEYDGHYTIEHENIEAEEIKEFRLKDMYVVGKIRDETWWVE